MTNVDFMEWKYGTFQLQQQQQQKSIEIVSKTIRTLSDLFSKAEC